MGWRYPGRFVLMLLLVLVTAGLSTSLFLFVEQILGFIGINEDDAKKFTPEEIAALTQTLKQYALIALALCPVFAFTSYMSVYLGQWLANRCMQEMRLKFTTHLIELDLSYHGQLARGDLFTRMSGDMERTQGLLADLYGKLQQHPFEILVLFGYLYWLNWIMAIGVTIIMIPVLIYLLKTFKRSFKRGKKAQQKMADTISTFEQIASGIRVIKAMGSQEAEGQRFEADNQDLFDAKMRAARARASSNAATGFLVFILTAGTFFFASQTLALQWVSPLEIGMFLMVIGRFVTIIRTSQRLISKSLDHASSALRVFHVLDQQSSIKDPEQPQPCPNPPQQNIVFDQVSFRYNSNTEPVLRQLSLEIPIGQSTAIVGESGAGKSTILDLIPRFYDVTDGSIKLDQIDIRSFRRDDYIHLFAIVQQDSFLFNDTVYKNIAYGSPKADRAAVEQAAKRAHVHDAIMALEGGLGYETMVGDRGERLSGGQRQRVAIARALLRDSPILLLDEPTSALDPDSERNVQEALAELMQGRTSIIVAHRLSTIQDADLIIVLDHANGCAKEQGSHQELIARNGAYAEMVRIQQLKEAES